MLKHSKIGLRLFLLFLFTAVVPVVTTVIYFGDELEDLSTRHLEEQLGFDAKNFAAAIHGKLLTADTILQQLGSEISLHSPIDISESARNVFLAVAVANHNNQWGFLFGDAQLLPKLSTAVDTARLVSLTAEDGEVHIALYQRNGGEEKQRALVGIINPEFLWLNEAASANTYYAIHGDGQRLALVQRNDLSGKLRLLDRRTDLSSELATQGRGLNTAAAFGAKPWQVSAARYSDSAALPSVKSAQALTIITFSILLLVALISSRQIRNIVAPLETLTNATRRLARQDFHDPLPVDGNDEIGQLATSFNSMSEKLGRQFRTLEGLSIIDESILTGDDIRNTSELILRQISETFACQQSTLCLLPENPGEKPQSLRYDAEVAGLTKYELHDQAILQDNMLPKKHDPIFYQLNEGFPRLFSRLAEAGITQLLVCPVISNETIIAYIGAGFLEPQENIEALITPLESFSRRVGVAIRSAQDAKQLYHRANYDALTGLYNRAHFIEQLNAAITGADESDAPLALLFIDLDRFKHVNDVQGHEAGDKLLIHIAQKLKWAIGDDAITARFGGDEFLVLLPDMRSMKYVKILAQTIINDLSQPIVIDFHEHFIDASIGIAMYPEHGQSAEILIKHTDIAMYRAKESGGGNYRVFDNQMNAHAMKRIALESALYHAIERNELFLVYQPKLCLNSGEIYGAETLIRWQHPIHGMVPPEQFVSIAEETGQILPIGNWIIDSAMKQLAAWQKKGLAIGHIAINASVRQIKSAGFVDRLKHCLKENSLEPSSIEIEITETMFIDDIENSTAVLEQLHKLGVSIAIDDFGTGYSSLSYLTQLPFDTLKIDRSFLDKVNHDSNAASIISAVIALAHSLGKTVVAEGVETVDHLQFLRERGCDLAQGFYYAKPLTTTDFEEYASKHAANSDRDVNLAKSHPANRAAEKSLPQRSKATSATPTMP